MTAACCLSNRSRIAHRYTVAAHPEPRLVQWFLWFQIWFLPNSTKFDSSLPNDDGAERRIVACFQWRLVTVRVAVLLDNVSRYLA